MPDWLARIIRTALQIGAAGGFTALITEWAKLVPPQYAPMILAGSLILVSFSQNLLEDKGVVPALLKPTNANTAKVVV